MHKSPPGQVERARAADVPCVPCVRKQGTINTLQDSIVGERSRANALLLRLKTESDAAAAATAAAEAMKKRATDVARNAARRKADASGVLMAWGVYVTKVDYDGPSTTANQKAKKKTFIGEDCAKLYAKHKLLVDMAVNSKNPKNQSYKDVWQKMEELSELFTSEARGKKRDLVIAIANLQKA